MLKFVFTCVFVLGSLFPLSDQALAAVDATLVQAKMILDRYKMISDLETRLVSEKIEANRKELRKTIERQEEKLEDETTSFLGMSKTDGVARALDLIDLKQEINKLRLDAQKLAAGSDTRKLVEGNVQKKEEELANLVSTQKKRAEQKRKPDSRFAGFGFGVAVGVTIDTGSHDRIEDASLDSNNVVRVDHERDVLANFLLESHYFFTPARSFLGLADEGNWGIGPFVAVQPGSDELIEGIGIGVMLGFKRAHVIAQNVAPELGDSFNLGVGFMVNPNEQILRDGIEANQPLPAGETDVQFKEKAQTGVVVLFSYSF